MSEQELEPCKCGNKKPNIYLHEASNSYTVKCLRCGRETGTLVDNRTKAEAITAWNTHESWDDLTQQRDTLAGNCEYLAKENTKLRQQRDDMKADVVALAHILEANSQKIEPISQTISEIKALVIAFVAKYDSVVKQRDELLKALEKIKANSYPGLAVHEGTLLNRIYKESTKAIAKAKERK